MLFDWLRIRSFDFRFGLYWRERALPSTLQDRWTHTRLRMMKHLQIHAQPNSITPSNTLDSISPLVSSLEKLLPPPSALTLPTIASLCRYPFNLLWSEAALRWGISVWMQEISQPYDLESAPQHMNLPESSLLHLLETALKWVTSHWENLGVTLSISATYENSGIVVFFRLWKSFTRNKLWLPRFRRPELTATIILKALHSWCPISQRRYQEDHQIS